MAEKKKPTAEELRKFQKRAAEGITSTTAHPGMQAKPYLNMLQKLQEWFPNDAKKKKKKPTGGS